MPKRLHVELGRRYRFAASHRLHSAQLSEEENRRIYGKCNNPYGHGHNYTVELRFSGTVDPATGMIANLADLDAFVTERVIEPFDHRSLQEDQDRLFLVLLPAAIGVEVVAGFFQRSKWLAWPLRLVIPFQAVGQEGDKATEDFTLVSSRHIAQVLT